MSGRVALAEQLLAARHPYAQGCSGFICNVLGIPWESANSLMGASPVLVGATNLNVGDIVGWSDSAAV